VLLPVPDVCFGRRTVDFTDRVLAAHTSADGCCELLCSTPCRPKAEGGFVPTEGRGRASRGPAHRRRLSKFASDKSDQTWIARRPVPRLMEEEQMRGFDSGITASHPAAAAGCNEDKTATVSRRSSFWARRRAVGLLAWYFWNWIDEEWKGIVNRLRSSNHSHA
jgi:hypothetical protein